MKKKRTTTDSTRRSQPDELAPSSKKRAKVSSFVKFRQVKQARYAKNGKQNARVPPERSGKQLLYLRIGGATIEELDITTAEYKESSHDRDSLNTHAP